MKQEIQIAKAENGFVVQWWSEAADKSMVYVASSFEELVDILREQFGDEG